MGDNKTKYISEEKMLKELKKVIIEFEDLESRISYIIEINTIDTQNKIDNLKKYNVIFRSNSKGVEDEIPSPEFQDMIINLYQQKLLEDNEKHEQKLLKEKETAREEATESCKSIINGVRQQIEDKVKVEQEKLDEIQEKLNKSENELEELKKAIKVLKLTPESRTFKVLDKEQQEIMEQKKQEAKERTTAVKKVKEAEEELDSFNSKYGNIDFESENAITDILTIMYGKASDYYIMLKEDLSHEEEEKQRIEKEKEEKKRLEEAKNNEKNGNEGQQSNQKQQPKPTPTTTPQQNSNQQQAKPKPNAQQNSNQQQPKPNPNPQQNSSQQQPNQNQPKANPIVDIHTAEENDAKQYPILKYNAKTNTYIARNPNDDYYIEIDRDKQEIDKYGEDSLRKTIIKHMESARGIKLKIDDEQWEHVDLYAVMALYEYDKLHKFKTQEEIKYIESIFNPEMSQDNRKVIYDLRGLNRNKYISKEDRQELLDHANYAKEFQIANVKKGIIASITERITNAINRNSNNKLDKGKSEAEIITEDLKDRKTRKRDNRFKKEIQVTNAYNDIEKQISNSDKDGLGNILANAREALREGKISTTEYSGLIYNAKIRNEELSNSKSAVKKEPAASTPQQESGNRG